MRQSPHASRLGAQVDGAFGATLRRHFAQHRPPEPYLFPSLTGGRFFARLGIQTYGFLPMLLPEGYDLWHYVHVADERIPVAAMEFGANAIGQVLQRYGA